MNKDIELTWLDYQKEVFFDFPGQVKYKIIPKGRRAGITRGGANAFIKKLVKGDGPLMWGDTVHGNIEKYYERYFYPVLKANKISHHFNSKDKVLKIGNHYADFRSADNPENWEGFAYKMIFLNEAGIILKNRSLYINSVLPMLIDHPDSKLIAAGVPKGKILKDGSEHPFYTLAKRAANSSFYQLKTFTSYYNPLLKEQDIRELEDEISLMNPEQVRQEIYGEFIEMDALNPFAHQYDPKKHESTEAIFDSQKQIVISLDFNLNPFAVTFSHIWKDSRGVHDHQFDEMSIENGSIPAMVDKILGKYGRWTSAALLTGDAMGKRGDISQRDNASLYLQLLRGLRMSQAQLRVKGNPTHENSRVDVNYLLLNHPDFKINPINCPATCRDMKTVQCDAYGEIIKRDRKDITQRADFMDCFVGETLITTSNGHVKIAEIKVNDLVLTSNGLNRVVDTWNSEAEVYEFEMNDGSKIQCTKDHKFFTHIHGWCSIYDIFAENISICKLSQENPEASTLNTTVGDTQNIATKNTFTSAEKAATIQGLFIDKFTLIISEKFQKGLQFITKMGMHLTTILQTLKQSIAANINECTWLSDTKRILPQLLNYNRQELRLLPYGIEAKKDLNGINYTRRNSVSENKYSKINSANFAEQNLNQKRHVRDSVAIIASQNGEELLCRTWLKGTVKNVEQNTKHVNTRREDSVHKNVNQFQTLTELKVKNCKYIGRERVYDITVENEHNFFANNILVHNCIRYKINTFWKPWIDNHQKMKYSQ